MVIYKQVRDDLRRYTFVEKVELKNHYVHIYYNCNGELKYKKLAYRADTRHIQKAILAIKKEIGFEETKKERDIIIKKELKKPMIFGNV